MIARKRPRVLLVEDDVELQERLARFLETDGYDVVKASRTSEVGSAEGLDAAIVDRMLPDGDGLGLVRRWRAEGVAVPILILTARVELDDKLAGLRAGATDYVTKPFEPRELSARLEAQIRQHRSVIGPRSRRLSCHGIELDSITREVVYRGTAIQLTRKQFDLLRRLMEQPGRVFSRSELLDSVWELGCYPTTRTVDNHVAQLRRMIAPELFETLHGVGYRLVEPADSRSGKNDTTALQRHDKHDARR